MSTIKIIEKRRVGVKEAPARFHAAGRRAMGKIIELARQIAIEKAPGLTGRLKGGRGGMGGINSRVEDRGKKIYGILGATARDPRTGHDYAPDVHEGTGLYGPKKKRIFPKKKKVMCWPKVPWTPWPKDKVGWKMARKKFQFAKSTKGQKPQPFLKWGIEAAQQRSKEFFDREIKNIKAD